MITVSKTFDILVITHGGCMDGLASAWVVRESFKDENHMFKYVFARKRNLIADLKDVGLELNDIKGCQVYITDYMYKAEEIIELVGLCSKLVIIDHHKTSESECDKCIGLPNIEINHDKTLSGCGLAWLVLMEGEIPWWIRYIQDRDLGKNDLTESIAINRSFWELKYKSFSRFDELNTYGPKQISELIQQGKKIMDVDEKITETICGTAQFCHMKDYDKETGELNFIKVAFIQTRMLIAETSRKIFEKNKWCEAIAIVTYNMETCIHHISLRSRDRGKHLDVANIAKRQGGGGHEGASAFDFRGRLSELFIPLNE